MDNARSGFTVALQLSEPQTEMLKAIGYEGPMRAREALVGRTPRGRKPTPQVVKVHGVYQSLRRIGLARSATYEGASRRVSQWRLTTVGAQVYEQLFGEKPNLGIGDAEDENEETEV